eukprot:3067629-Prymnesium_polylepis.1
MRLLVPVAQCSRDVRSVCLYPRHLDAKKSRAPATSGLLQSCRDTLCCAAEAAAAPLRGGRRSVEWPVAVDCDPLQLAVRRPIVVDGPVLRDAVVPDRDRVGPPAEAASELSALHV